MAMLYRNTRFASSTSAALSSSENDCAFTVHAEASSQIPARSFPWTFFPKKVSLSLSLSLSLPPSLPPSLVLALSPAVCPVCVHTRVHKVGENTSLVPLFDESFVVWDLLEPDSTDQTKLDPRK